MVLVTGASGLVGSHLIRELIRQDKEVRAIYRNNVPAVNCAGKVQWVKADILDIPELVEACEGIEQVYHCAGMVSFSPGEKHLLYKINIEGTANVVNACLSTGVKKLVHVSSVSALGRLRENTVVNETMNWTKETSNSEYGKTKYLGEMEVWRGVGEGLDAVIVNPVIILGDGDWNSGSTGIFKNVYNEFPWYTEGVTGFTDVADVVKAMIMLMESDVTAQRFIISAANVGYHELFTQVAEGFKKKPAHKKVTPLMAEIVWRLEAVKGKFTGKKPLLTKETAHTAQAKVYFDNSKLMQFLPQFTYTPIKESVDRICAELKRRYNLA
ncbi:MAG TPA: NAD-dependent epimerase/dehydratase family protein [Chitinophagaceae bacterium]|nr:NAD-dependent epimerase/dehydratase family protein [Chitinophagaceae bacterium]